MSLKRIMAEMERELQSEKDVMIRLEKRKKELPPGSLNVEKRNGNSYLFQNVTIDGKRKRIALNKDNTEDRIIIKELMEKKTIVHGIPLLKKNINAMEKCIQTIRPYSPRNYEYGALLGKEYYLAGDVCINEWLKKSECQNRGYSEFLIHETKRGVKVRSKSEVLIADTFYDLGILAKYETLLVLEGRFYYPDFEFVHPRENRLMWWEHLGMLDNPSYVFDNLERINVFARNGIIIGNNLILTWETPKKPLTHKMINDKLRSAGIIE